VWEKTCNCFIDSDRACPATTQPGTVIWGRIRQCSAATTHQLGTSARGFNNDDPGLGVWPKMKGLFASLSLLNVYVMGEESLIAIEIALGSANL